MASVPAQCVSSDGGTRVNVLGNLIRIIVRSRDTAGTVAVVECSDPPHPGPPPHTHHPREKIFHVLPGQYEFAAGGRLLAFFSPGGFGRCFEEVHAPASPAQQPAVRMVEPGPKHGLKFLPPE